MANILGGVTDQLLVIRVARSKSPKVGRKHIYLSGEISCAARSPWHSECNPNLGRFS